MSYRTSRRRFLQTTAATGIGFWVAGGAEAQQSRSANERIAFASIGIGGKGSSDSADAGKAGDMVAICDVDDSMLRAGKTRFPKAKCYSDFRQMLDEMGDSIDAVTVSTPDHVHGPAALMAMRMGKHCFCQKPLAHTVYEARLMAQVAREQNVATQMGNQFTAYDSLRKAAAVIQSGTLGTVKEVHVWTNRPVWPQGGPRPKPAECPKHIHWDFWLGPAPERPYANGYHPFSWRGYWDFGTGALGDMACHTVNMPYMALDLRDPVSVQAETTGHNRDSYPARSTIHFDFPAIGDRPAVQFVWYDGGNRPPKEMFAGKGFPKDQPVETSGCLIVGEHDKFYCPGDYCEKNLYLLSGAPLPKVEWVRSPGHFEEWVAAIRGGEPARSNFPDYAGKLTETILLGNLAVWVAASGKGEKVLWDVEEMCSPNVAGLETIVRPTYRCGYMLDECEPACRPRARRRRRCR
jgi:predicted dehydrogenase